nr:dentin sialophosphoprotein-like [Leptinotarsa decemlineata]
MKTEISTENGNDDYTSKLTTNTSTTGVDFMNGNVTNIMDITTSGVEESTTSSSEKEVSSTRSTRNNSTRNEYLQNVSTEQPSPGGDSESSININITEINRSSIKTEITTENGDEHNTSDSTTNTPTTEVNFMNENVTNIMDITTSGVKESTTSSSEEEVSSARNTTDNSTRNENIQNVSTEQPSPSGDSEENIHTNITEINGSSMKTEITTENGNDDYTSKLTTNTPTTGVNFMNGNVTNFMDITTSGVEESTTSSSEKEVSSTRSTTDNSIKNEYLQNFSTEQPSSGGDSELSIHINITEINGSSIETDITTENGNNDNTSYSTTNTPTTQVDFINENVTNIIDITTSGEEELTTSSSEEKVGSTESTMDNLTRNENLQNVSTEQPSPGGNSEVSIHINITEINGSSMKTDITTENGNNDSTSYSTTNTPTTEVDFINENVTNIIDITTSGEEELTTYSSEEKVGSTESTMDNSTRNENIQNVTTEQPSPGGNSEVSIHINITEINGSSMKTDITTENGNNDNTSYSTTNIPTTEVDFINENVTNIIDITTSGEEELTTSSSEEKVGSTGSTMDNSTKNENLQNVSTEQPSPGGDSEVSTHINITEINGSSMKTDITTENGNNDNTSYSTTNTPTTEVDFIDENVTNIIDITTSGVEKSNTSSSEEKVISTESTMDNSTRNENIQNVSTEQPSPGGDSEVGIHINITEINGSSMKTDITTENGNNGNTSGSTTNTPTTEVDFNNENVTNIIDITTPGEEELTTSSSEEKVGSTESTMDNSTK